MTTDEAIDEVVYLKGLFPMTTDEQARYWRDKFLQYERDPVRRAIERFADKHSDFVDRAGLLDLISIELRRDQPVANPQLERAQADEHWKKIDAAVRAIPPADLERLQAEVVAGLSERLRESAKRRGLDSPLVKALIYKAITHG